MGPGNAAKEGYIGRAGIDTVDCHIMNAMLKPVATAVERRISSGVPFGAVARISGSSGGPTSVPPVATTALMLTPLIVAASCHWFHAVVTAVEASRSIMRLRVDAVLVRSDPGSPPQRLPG